MKQSHASSTQEFQSLSDQILAANGYLGVVQDSSFVPETSLVTNFLWVVKDVLEDNSQLYSGQAVSIAVIDTMRQEDDVEYDPANRQEPERSTRESVNSSIVLEVLTAGSALAREKLLGRGVFARRRLEDAEGGAISTEEVAETPPRPGRIPPIA